MTKKKEETVEEKEVDAIEVGEPLDLRPKNLPLVIKLPKGASEAQIAYAEVLNSYAYVNPTKWKAKKDSLIKRLELLAETEILAGNSSLSIAGSKQSFVFIKDPATGEEIYAQPGVQKLEE